MPDVLVQGSYVACEGSGMEHNASAPVQPGGISLIASVSGIQGFGDITRVVVRGPPSFRQSLRARSDGHPMELITNEDVADPRAIYKSLRGGNSRPEEYFTMPTYTSSCWAGSLFGTLLPGSGSIRTRSSQSVPAWQVHACLDFRRLLAGTTSSRHCESPFCRWELRVQPMILS